VSIPTPTPVLADVLAPGMEVVFCGTAVGDASKRRGAYYAGPGNKFWQVLAEFGFTDRILKPEEYSLLPRYRIGLTDIAKSAHGADARLRAADFDADSLAARILGSSPLALAFNGKRAACEFFRLRSTSQVAVGRHLQKIGSTAIYVLPSTSGGARRYGSPEPWAQLARDLGLGRGPQAGA